MLDGLDGADRDFAQGVRKAIFTFAHVPRRLKAADVPRVLRAVEPRLIAQALVVARQGPPEDGASADFILASLPQRLGDSLREEMETLGAVKPKDGEAAQAALVSAIREAAAAAGVNVNTVRTVYARLETEGLVTSEQGRGTFVERDGVTQPAPAPRFSRTPATLGDAPALPGEHTRAALTAWGIDDVEALLASGAATQV